ncbi:MAG TPA: adenylate/guanylate cyclase domain-containing protein [Azospirillaceae bacterium]|nr:adenylate/guanylate cyclase domain-containing protein [Azospirillaceae bacterium]
MATDTTTAETVAADALTDWLLTRGRDARSIEDLLSSYGRHLVACGYPVRRVGIQLWLLHPVLSALSMFWHATRPGEVETLPRAYGTEVTPAYLNSPIAAISERGSGPIRLRIEHRAPPWTFPVEEDFKRDGMTDYLALPLGRFDSRRNVLTYLSDKPGGFDDNQIAGLQAAVPALAVLLERETYRRLTVNILDTYVGRQAGARILSGDVRRGTGETIRAVIWFSDMRGFTALSDRLPREELIALLNNYFELQGEAVHAAGGEILKFMGDGMLAAWPLAAGADPGSACHAALGAARVALNAISSLNAERAGWGQPFMRVGTALHYGDVMYGNIGAPTRLDFTVVGPAVNLASRIEGLCRLLDRDLLTSRLFADAAGSCGLASLGSHPVRGLEERIEVMGLGPCT